jgi:predicted anti-sigma-YlaC factor YlaD
MECLRVLGLVSEYLGGELSPGLREEIERHLQICPRCREEYASSEKLWGMLDLYRDLEPSLDFKTRLLSRLSRTRPRFAMAMALAACVLLSVLAFFLLIGDKDRVSPEDLSPQEIQIIQDLDLLEDYDVVQMLALMEEEEDLKLLEEFVSLYVQERRLP